MPKRKAPLDGYIPTQAQASSYPGKYLECGVCGEKTDLLTTWIEEKPKIVALTKSINVCNACAAERAENEQP
jgi:hypothetical protein